MASNVKVKLNHAGFEALLKSEEMRAVVAPHAQAVLAAAQADPHDDTGEYEAGLEIQHATTDRAVERVVATDPKSPILEARYGILARAASAAGGS